MIAVGQASLFIARSNVTVTVCSIGISPATPGTTRTRAAVVRMVPLWNSPPLSDQAGGFVIHADSSWQRIHTGWMVSDSRHGGGTARQRGRRFPKRRRVDPFSDRFCRV